MKKGKTLEDFKTIHVPKPIAERVRAALADLGDSWESTADFARRAGTSPKHLAPVRAQFSDHQVVVKSSAGAPLTLWAGTKTLAEKMRKAYG